MSVSGVATPEQPSERAQVHRHARQLPVVVDCTIGRERRLAACLRQATRLECQLEPSGTGTLGLLCGLGATAACESGEAPPPHAGEAERQRQRAAIAALHLAISKSRSWGCHFVIVTGFQSSSGRPSTQRTIVCLRKFSSSRSG